MPGNLPMTRALATIMDEKNITSPRKGGLSVYGTNVLTNITNNMGGYPQIIARLTSFGDRAEKISGEYVKDQYPGQRSHLPCLPGSLQEGSRDQGWSLRRTAHGKRGIRTCLVCWRLTAAMTMRPAVAQ